jgi:hypothetical protein
VIFVVVALLIPPTLFWIRHLTRRVWPNTSRAVETVVLLRRVVLTALIGYSVAALLARLLADLSPWTMPGSNELGLLLATVSLAAACGAILVGRRRPIR